MPPISCQPNNEQFQKTLKNNPKKIRRGRGESRKSINDKNSNITIIGNNCAGLTGKIESLKRTIEVFAPGVIMMQETKLKKQGKIKLKGYVIFEKYREHFNGGGLMSAVHENLNPILIADENSEFLVVDISGNFGVIRTINCYGPQENMPLEVRSDFFIELEKRIIIAKSENKMICIECDANSKLGKSWIPGDPHEISANGKLLADMISNQNLVVVNSTDKCHGVITRFKKTINGQEKSILDYYIVCQELFQNNIHFIQIL